MTNKEAIKYLIAPTATSTSPSESYLKQKEAYELAIKALKENLQGEGWLDNFIKNYNASKDFQITDIRDRGKLLDELRPQGKWIFHEDYNENCKYGCNKCGSLNNIPSNFCPNCGVKMKDA